MIRLLKKTVPSQQPSSFKRLLQSWQNVQVSQTYQKIILAYLASIPNDEAEDLIQKEIQETEARSGINFKFDQQLQQRKKLLLGLKKLIEDEVAQGKVSTSILSEIAKLLNELRSCTLFLIETIIELNQQQSMRQNTLLEVKQFLLELHYEHRFLKESILNRFMLFQEEFDPMFLYHQEHRNQEKPQFNHPIFDQLFKIDISYAARIRKAHRKAQKMLNKEDAGHSVAFKRRSHSYNPVTKITHKDEDNEEESKKSRRSKSNFKIRSLAIQGGIGAEINFNRVSERATIIKRQKFNFLKQALSKEVDPEQEQSKTNPCKAKFYRSKFNKGLKLFNVNQEFVQTKRHSFNLKDKLVPIQNNKSKQLLIAESTCLNSTRSFFLQPICKEGPKVDDQELELKSTNDSQKIKDIRMRASKLCLEQVEEYLRENSINQDINKQIYINGYSVSMAHNQSYFSQFLVNGEAKAVGLIIQLLDSQFLIRFWSPLERCNEYTSNILFKKYFDYLQKQTTCSKIYLYGQNQKLAMSFGFEFFKEKLFVYNINAKKNKKTLEFSQFLSLKCTNILIPQENTTISMLYSDQIQPFNESNYFILPAIAEIDRQKMSQQIQLLAKISHEISGMKALNSLLQDEQLDTFGVTPAMNSITNISALRLASQIQFSSSFVAGQGLFKFNGHVIFRKDGNQICEIVGINKAFSVLVGKGFSNLHSFINASRKKSKTLCEFSVRMFNKLLYGRMVNNNLNRCSYANWEISLSFKDELQGRVKHNMEGVTSFGPQPFYCAIQMNSDILLAFEVGADDFLY